MFTKRASLVLIYVMGDLKKEKDERGKKKKK